MRSPRAQEEYALECFKIGGGAAIFLTRLIATLLYHVGPHDALAFGSAFMVMSGASFTGCLVPALRAAQTDPWRALRDL